MFNVIKYVLNQTGLHQKLYSGIPTATMLS